MAFNYEKTYFFMQTAYHKSLFIIKLVKHLLLYWWEEVVFEQGAEKYLLDWLKMEQIFEKLKLVLVIKNTLPQR